MNKSALKTFAMNARRELLKKVEAKAMKIGITEDSIKKAEIESSDAIFIGGKQLSKEEKTQRYRLIDRIKQIGFKRVMEEVAYTWFNRFTALRFMEVNDYLQTKVRVLSSTNADSTEPDMMKEALSLDLDLDKEYIYELKMNNSSEELFKYLIIKHCNDLNRYMPFMFEKIDDYTEILFPEGLLATDSFVRQMTNTEVIPEDNWEKVEIIGWLYQYYIAEENERVIKAKKRYKVDELPFATQLFTPEWIVRYMVQNALGRYWIESHPEHRDLIQNWEFYLDNPNPEPDFEEKLAPHLNKGINVEEIKCFDPAMGSGHILVYMFDVLYQIYIKCGYMEREIPRLIIEKNLYGLDIDDRAYQLASFSVVMKALQYNKRFLRSVERDGLTMNLASIQETNTLSDEEVAFLAGESSGEQFNKMKNFIDQFKYGKSIGSLIKIKFHDAELLQQRLIAIKQQSGDLFELEMKERILALFRKLINQVKLMDLKYDILITNPPYVGNSYVTTEVSAYLTKEYPDVKSDLFSSFMEYSFHATKENGQMGFMTPFVWMFISSFEKLRRKIIGDCTISSLVQLEYSGFDGATVPICTFTLRNYSSDIKGEYVKLSNFRGVENQPIKTMEAVRNPAVSYRYKFDQGKFSEIPGSPIAYWVSDRAISTFEKIVKDSFKANAGISTGKNDLYVFYWHEVDFNKVCTEVIGNSNHTFYPLSKGGEFRKWYGNKNHIIKYNEKSLEEMGKLPGFRHDGNKYYFSHLLSWSKISSSKISVRYYEPTHIFDNAAPSISSSKIEYELLGFLNSKLADYFLTFLSPTLNFQPGYIELLPLKVERDETVSEIVANLIAISKNDWDSFETSWDFKRHNLIKQITKDFKIKTSFNLQKEIIESQFVEMKKNEEKLNEIFIDAYGMQGDLTSEIEDKDITIRKADLVNNIKSFISFAIGCSLGRYSLDEEGLIYAGGKFDPTRYSSFPVDGDNIIPVLSGTYFEDDIVSRFIDFVRATFSQETLEENLDFITDAIGRKSNETAREALRRYFLNDFYKDHVQTYKKRPIYWLFTSGKEKAFNCLIYMHRYDKTTLSRIRTDYLHEYQLRLDAEKRDILNIIEGDSTAKESSSAKKELKSLDKKIEELKAYDELLHHMADMQIEIDLDNGVKVNYEKFKGIVAKI